MSPLFLVVTDIAHGAPPWRAAEAQTRAVGDTCTPILGFRPEVKLVALDPPHTAGATLVPGTLGHALDAHASRGGERSFLLPAILDFGLFQKQALVEVVREARRNHPGLSVHYDDPDVCHRLLVQAFAESMWERLASTDVAPARLGVLVVAGGHGDAQSRAKTYQLMRLLWEQLAFAQGEVAFVRHPRPSLPEALEHCLRSPFQWLALPQMLWPGEHLSYAKLLLDDFRAAHPGAPELPLGDPVGARPATTGWLGERLLSLWQAHRDKAGARMPSPKHDLTPPESCVHGPEASCTMDILPRPLGPDLAYGPGVIAEICDTEGLARLLDHFGIAGDRVFVKVTWHGYAAGTYTDPIALDRLLSALPGKAVLLEGHTTGRNLGGATWDWETESEAHRTWIRQQDLEFLRRTGLADVIARHGAQYVNVTEAYWDGACAPREKVLDILSQRGVRLRFPEIADYVPEVLLEHRGAPFISFARFKGPTRLCISNCFGLLPPPLRAAWHGATIDHFARVCCDVARLYGCLFRLFGLAEALHVAVRWNRAGLYRSRWGNYDLIADPGMITLCEGLPGADVLASRLQGQDVRRSAFFAAVNEELGLSEAAVTWPIEEHLIRRFA